MKNLLNTSALALGRVIALALILFAFGCQGASTSEVGCSIASGLKIAAATGERFLCSSGNEIAVEENTTSVGAADDGGETPLTYQVTVYPE